MPQINNFDDVHVALTRFIPSVKQNGKYSLDRMRELMDRLGNPQDSFKTIHVAGTSGKTSTCYYIAALLQQSGKKVGLTISPHVDEVNERVQINMRPLPEKIYSHELDEFMKIIEATSIKPTYFELLIAFAYWEFAKQKIDYAVVEVGLGGLHDGTNIIHRPDKVCVITDIGLDHTDVLGGTLAEIAAQKAGIIQDHNSVFTYIQSSEVMEQVKARCASVHAVIREVQESKSHGVYKNLPPFQTRNLGLAQEVYEYIAKNDGLSILSSNQLRSVSTIVIPARMEVINYKGKTIIIDGSHNEQKIDALLKGVRSKYSDQPIAALISFGQNKSEVLQASLSLLSKEVGYLIVTKFKLGQEEIRRPIDPKKVAEICSQAGFKDTKVITDPVRAFKQLLKRPEKLLLVTGSFYLLNHIRPLILKK